MRYPDVGDRAPFQYPFLVANGDEKSQYQTARFCATQGIGRSYQIAWAMKTAEYSQDAHG
jgi:hypothetical protein